MSSISSLNNALSGMQAAQSQLNIVGNNISNIDTKGYTRKVAQASSVVLGGENAGVKISEITRSVSQSLVKSYLTSAANAGTYNMQSTYLGQAETFLGTPEGNNSIAASVTSLQTAVTTFSNDVTTVSSRYTLLNSASTLASRLNYLTSQIQQLRGDADMKVGEIVEEINDKLYSLKEVNANIVKYGALEYNGLADLEDQRDQLLKELSSYIDISYFSSDNNGMIIQTSSGDILLDSEVHELTHTSVSQTSTLTSYEAGSIDGIYLKGKDITSSIRSGEIKGLTEVRDVTLPALQAQLDQLTAALSAQINAAHNQGTTYPDINSEFEGSRTFINPSEQIISISDGDVRFVVFDAEGNQVATASLGADLGFTSGTITKKGTTDGLVETLDKWLTSANGAGLTYGKVEITSDGHLLIDTGDSSYTLAVLDEKTSIAGSEKTDVTIGFDSTGDGTVDRAFSGFSSFFGLNDFFQTLDNESVYDSKAVSSSSKLGIAANAVIGFANRDNPAGLGTITVNATDSLQDIANKINKDATLSQNLIASVMSTGTAYILRIADTSGHQLEIYESGTTTGLLDKLGMAPSSAGASGAIKVKDSIAANANKIAAGSAEYNVNTGKYGIDAGSSDVAIKMSKVFASSITFGATGNMASSTTTLSNYAAVFVGNLSAAVSNANSNLEYQNTVTNTIETKAAEISGVDLDEELSMMIIYQQAYSACAQVFSVSKEMMDMLINSI